MRRSFRRLRHGSRGFAGIEFGLIAPVLLLLLGGMADLALAFWNKGLLVSSVAEGAQYAFLAGPTVSASSVRGIVGQKLSLPAGNVTMTGPDCFCVSGTPATPSARTCGQTCPNSRPAEMHLQISARYTYPPLLPVFSRLTDFVFVEAARVRLK